MLNDPARMHDQSPAPQLPGDSFPRAYHEFGATAAGGCRAPIDEATGGRAGYYNPVAAPPQQHRPQFQHHSFYPQGPHFQPPPQSHYAAAPQPTSLKRKSTATVAAISGRAGSPPALSQDTLCDLCHHPDPILFSAVCSHVFHSRCVHVWPLLRCPVCEASMPHASVLRLDMNAQIDTRAGKWTRAEEKFIDVILTEFDRNSLPLANGTPVRLVLAKLLNCSTMRLSKKFQKNALGKRTFRVVKPVKGGVALEFRKDEHALRQREFSRLEMLFRHELVEQFRRENNTEDGAYAEVDDLRLAVRQFWVVNFLKLAILIGQPVQGMDVSDSKKKKQALQMLRHGQYDELLSWSQGSPANTPSIAPLTGSTIESSVQHLYMPPPSGEIMHHHHHPSKKLKMPEGGVLPASDARYEIHGASGMDSVYSSYAKPEAGYQDHAPAYLPPPPGSPYSRRGDMYSNYSMPKPLDKPGSYQQEILSHHQPHPMDGPSYHGHHHPGASSGLPPPVNDFQRQPAPAVSYTRPAEASSSMAGPWEELLDGLSESSQQVVDPALQAWSNLHIM